MPPQGLTSHTSDILIWASPRRDGSHCLVPQLRAIMTNPKKKKKNAVFLVLIYKQMGLFFFGGFFFRENFKYIQKQRETVIMQSHCLVSVMINPWLILFHLTFISSPHLIYQRLLPKTLSKYLLAHSSPVVL